MAKPIQLYLLAAILFCALSSRAQTWTPLYQGVDYKLIEKPTPDALRVHVVRVDLLDPEVELVVSEPSPTEPAYFLAKMTSTFLSEQKVQVAINGSGYFPVWLEGEGSKKKSVALAMTKGVVHSPNQFEDAAICVGNNGKVQIAKFDSKKGFDHTDIQTALGGWAIGGSSLLVSNGKIPNTVGLHDERVARTALGLNQQRTQLFLVVVEGGPRGGFWFKDQISTGVYIKELVRILKKLGVYDAINLDGSGASTLAFEDETQNPWVANLPSDYKGFSERAVATHLGIRAKRLPGARPYFDTLKAQKLELQTLQDKLQSEGLAQKTHVTSSPLALEALINVDKKPDGASSGNIQRDVNGVTWLTKQGQKPAYEYMGAKIFNSIYGGQSPIVELVEAPGKNLTASMLLLGFSPLKDLGYDRRMMTAPRFAGDLDVKVGMDFIGLEDRHEGNLGVIQDSRGSRYARVDFDHSFAFSAALQPFGRSFDGAPPHEIPAVLERLSQVPDERILAAYQNACVDLARIHGADDCQKDLTLANLPNTLAVRKKQLAGLIGYSQRLRAYVSEFLASPDPKAYDTGPMLHDFEKVYGHRCMACMAVAQPDLRLFTLLLKAGVDWNARNLHGRLINDMLQSADGMEALELMVQHAADFFVIGGKLLANALSYRKLELATWLLNNGANPEAEDHLGRSVLIAAIAEGWTDIAKLALKKGADANKPYAWTHQSPLSFVLDTNVPNLELADTLLQHGAEVNTTDRYSTLFIRVIKAGFTRSVRWLINHGVDLNDLSGDPLPPLYHVLENRQKLNDAVNEFALAELMVRRGADVNAVRKNYANALERMQQAVDVKAVQWLKKNGAFVPVYVEPWWLKASRVVQFLEQYSPLTLLGKGLGALLAVF